MDNFERMLRKLMGQENIKGEFGLGRLVEKPEVVFRVEMPNGKGPYNSGLDGAKRYPGAPKPIYDFLVDNGAVDLAEVNGEQMGVSGREFFQRYGAAHYGCNSKFAVDAWFNERVRRYLRDEWGAGLYKFIVQPGQHILEMGHGEVIFSKPDAVLAERLDLVNMEKINA